MKPSALLLISLYAFSAFASERHCDASMATCAAHFKAWAAKATFSGIMADGLFLGGKVVVTEVAVNSPAAKAGVAVGDELLAVNGLVLAGVTQEAWKANRQSLKPGDEVVYVLKRNGERLELTLTMIAFPADLAAQKLGSHIMNAHLHEFVNTASVHN